ncbi:MAG: hypothetical protein MUF22_00880 [Chitinispirillaceae bacterium]|jgi:hypothetical protein|nr:hypothetical protein [Chitinispirillaceae bacterium]
MNVKSLGALLLFLGIGGFPSLAQDTLSSAVPGYADIIDDWKDQDNVAGKGYRTVITAIIATLPAEEKTALQTRLNSLAGQADNSTGMQALYLRVCSARRAMRMAPYLARFQKVVFSQHETRGGAYFNNDVWTQGGYGGKGVELLTMNSYYGKVSHLLPTGEARDLDVSFDGTKILFSWRGGDSRTSAYKIYEMDVATKAVRAITKDFAGLAGYQWGICDYEGIYLPNGNILFNSTRHVQEIDCISGPAVNMFVCDKDGKYLRQLCFDQVPTDYPQVLPDGRVIYCRWDYNDKAHTYSHALFVMKPDGTEQREYCNNNSWWPTMILQQRPIPGTTRIMAMIGGYHTPREGKIGIIDVNFGMQNGKGITLLAPVRLPQNNTLDPMGPVPTAAAYPFPFPEGVLPRAGTRPLDQWGQVPPMFAYPYPFDDSTFLVSFRPASKTTAWAKRFGLYFMNASGSRELLFYDPAGSACGAVVLSPRTLPPVLSSSVDYRQTTGTFQIMNLYDPRNSESPVLQGIDPKTIKRLRIAGLEFRPGPGMGGSSHFASGCINYGGATYHTPIAINTASWDLKWIYGETPVLADGSVSFTAPARTPLFFQLLDSAGNVIQTMRSWTMVQPGEIFSCMGCHESKLSAPPPLSYVPLALRQEPVAITPFYGPARGFSFAKEIQPIFDAKCVRCHKASLPNGIDLSGVPVQPDPGFRRNWLRSYYNLVNHPREACTTKYVNWLPAEESPILQPPLRFGAVRSPLVKLLAAGHEKVVMTKEEMDKIRCWIDLGVPFAGTYTEGMNAADSAALGKNFALRRAWKSEENKNIAAFIAQVGTVPDNRYRSRMVISSGNWNFSARYSGSSGLKIAYSVPPSAKDQLVILNMYTLRGTLVESFLKERTAAGFHTLSIPLSGIGTGQYVVSLKSGGFEQTVRILIVK